MSRRVVITGMGGVTALGEEWSDIVARLRLGKNAVRIMEDWAKYDGLNTRLGAPIVDFKLPSHYPRKKVRSMGRVAQLATVASERAIRQSGLFDDPVLSSGKTGIAYGSSTGSTAAIGAFGIMLKEHSVRGINANTYIQMMPHTTAVNVGLFFGLKGRVIATSTACTSGSQAIGYAYESIKYGLQDVMVAGGAEELCATEAAVFDTLFATSQYNDAPEFSPRPFDRQRDGLVIGEGAATLILEEYEHAKERGATIFAEVMGFASNCDAAHVTQPCSESMQQCMQLALDDADFSTSQIQYVNAHGTATAQGDVAESRATSRLFGPNMPISSQKSYLGHTLGACGAIEAWWTIMMMHEGWLAPTINLDNLDPECGELEYITGTGLTAAVDCVMTNNFAFGGINTSLILKKWNGAV